MTRLHLCVLLVAGIVSVPRPAAGDEPLRTLCATPGQHFCISLLTFEFSQSLTQDLPGGGMRGSQRWLTTFEPFGGGFFNSPIRVVAYLNPAYLYGGDSLLGQAMVGGPGTYATGESSPGTTLARSPTAFDVGYLFISEDILVRCGPQRGGGAAPDCVEVPEPATFLLLLSGLLALGFAVWRRQSV